MPLKINITETRKGPTLKLTVSVIIGCNKGQPKKEPDNISSNVFHFDDLVDVSVKTAISGMEYPNVEYTPSVPYTMSLSSKKNELAKDVNIKINVTCKELNFSSSWICSDDWAEMCLGLMRAIRTLYHPGSVVFSSVVEVRVNVHKVEKPSFIKLYEDSDFTDFNLITQGGAVAFHKALLAAHSDVFKTMFSGNWKETNENMLEMKGYSLETVKHMKDFLYLHKLPENYDDLCPLAALAVQYCIADLKAECIRVLAETVTPENLYPVHEFACKNNLPELTYALMELTTDDIVNGSYEYKKKLKTEQTA